MEFGDHYVILGNDKKSTLMGAVNFGYPFQPLAVRIIIWYLQTIQ